MKTASLILSLISIACFVVLLIILYQVRKQNRSDSK